MNKLSKRIVEYRIHNDDCQTLPAIPFAVLDGGKTVQIAKKSLHSEVIDKVKREPVKTSVETTCAICIVVFVFFSSLMCLSAVSGFFL